MSAPIQSAKPEIKADKRSKKGSQNGGGNDIRIPLRQLVNKLLASRISSNQVKWTNAYL